ncbi:hypothetical protein JCM6882_005025 [Rhodosporidiobolus microsporus]
MQVDVLQAYSSAIHSLSHAPSHLAQAQSTFAAFLDPLSPLPLEQRKTKEVDDAYKVLLSEGAVEGVLDDYLDSLRNSFPLIRADIDAALAQFSAATTDQARFEVVLALLHCLGAWIQRWQAPVSAVWASASSLSLFRRTFLSHLFHALPPSFSPALQSLLKYLLALPAPSPSPSTSSSSSSNRSGAFANPSHHIAHNYPSLPLALPTLLTLLDRFDPLLFGLIYDEIERRINAPALPGGAGGCGGREAWGEGRLEGVVRWLNGGGDGGGGVGKEGPGAAEGVLGWVSTIYDAAGSSSSSSLTTTTSSLADGGSGGAGDPSGKGKGKERERDKDRDKDKERAARAEDAKKFLKPTFSRFEYHVHKVLGQLRTEELYDIVLAFPESRPALEDLKTALLKTTPTLSPLIRSLSAQLRARLLHPGSPTPYIIATYISLVRALRVVDPGGVLVSRVGGEVRAYLRSRKDTIHHIISSLLSPSSTLFSELVSTTSSSISSSHPSGASSGGAGAGSKSLLLVSEGRDEAENYADPKWVPEPVEAPEDFRKSRNADILQLLVSIYDTKDVFVKELQVLLAQRLLAIKDYNLEAEIQNLATLKLRFGDQALQGCDVMVKDLDDSRRLDEAVHGRIPDSPLHATIVSRLFWPSFQHAPLKLPGQMGRARSLYLRTFSRSINPSKKLRWLAQLGSVDMSLTMDDGRIVRVEGATVVQAAVGELLDQQSTWTAADLASSLKLADAASARNALYFWANLGVVRQLSRDEAAANAYDEDAVGDVWMVVEDAAAEARRVQGAGAGGAGLGEAGGEGAQQQQQQQQLVVEEEQQAVQSVEEQRVEQMRVFWQFVQGMLTNLGALPLSRIHSTLNMLAPGYKGRTVDELTALLEAVKAEGLVTRTAKGDWKIVK